MPFFLSSIIKGYTVLSFSAIWTGSTLLAILSSLIKVNVYTVILRNSLIRVFTICHSQQSNHGLRCLPFSAVWSGSTLFTILSSLIKVKVYTVILRNILIRFYTICHSQQSDQGQGLHCHSQEQTDQVLQYLPFSAAWSRSTHAILSSQIRVSLLAILNSLIKVYTVCHSQQPVTLTLFPIISSLIRVYTFCHSQQSDQGLHCLPFSEVWSGSTLFAIFSLMKVYTICLS